MENKSILWDNYLQSAIDTAKHVLQEKSGDKQKQEMAQKIITLVSWIKETPQYNFYVKQKSGQSSTSPEMFDILVELYSLCLGVFKLSADARSEILSDGKHLSEVANLECIARLLMQTIIAIGEKVGIDKSEIVEAA